MEQVAEFTPDIVVQHYRILSQGSTKDQRAQANRMILKFIASDSAWHIAEQLLLPQQGADIQFIGAQALYQKLQNDADYFMKDQNVKSLRDSIFRLIKDMDMQKSRIAVERLCMAIAYIAIKSCNTFWEDSITTIIQEGSVDQKQCYISLQILKHIALIFDQQTFDKRTSSAVENFLRSNLSQLLEFLNQIITNPQSVARECYDLALSTAKHWCEYSSKTFIPNDNFISSLFLLINQGSLESLKVFKIFKKLLFKSKYAKILESSSFEQAFRDIPEKDQQFLHLIVEYLKNNRETFIQSGNLSLEDDDAHTYAMKYTQLLMAICQNYEILLIRESDTSKVLFYLLLDNASCKNLKISQQTLEFWEEFKETIINTIEDLNKKEYLFNPYVEVFKILITQCKKALNHAKTYEEQDEIDQQERGMSVMKYRDFTQDVYFKAYLLIKKIFREEGQKLIFGTIIEKIKLDDPMLFESAIFTCKSLLDAMEQSQIDIEFLKVVFESIIGQPVCQQCRHKFGDEEFQILYNHLQQNYTSMQQDHVGKLIEGVSTICAELPHDKLGLAIQQTLSIAISFFNNIDIQKILTDYDTRFELVKSLAMLSGSIKALEHIDQEILYQNLFPIVSGILNLLFTILEQKYNDTEVVLYICNFFQRLFHALKSKLKDIFQQLAKSLITCFNLQPENISCLQVFTLSCQMLKDEPSVQTTLGLLYDELCQVIMSKIYLKGQVSIEALNTDVIKSLSELMNRVAEMNINILKNSKYFNDIIILFSETLLNVNEKETNNQLVLFFCYLIQSRNAMDIVDKYLDYMTVGLICSIPKEQGTLLEKISNALVILMNNAETSGQTDRLQMIMAMALQKPVYSFLSERIRQLFINVLFSLKFFRPKIRLALVNMNGLVNGVIGEDSFIGLEIEAQNALKLQQAQMQREGTAQVINLD
ncbi:transportin-serine arginine isoform a [Stylonychia lemnae]|uniref:Transportin-serine arginine isoform a n=1 Tax=Stylonychia lemnae TaxID=5949 RepID=A0A078A778_STYLE|nr:transportin-serine arginine isoform a [Stylonychia lemnae]|eukprot:CDW78104.1 transportin-serine arginine isoform a [Stylonychia lemnae]